MKNGPSVLQEFGAAFLELSELDFRGLLTKGAAWKDLTDVAQNVYLPVFVPDADKIFGVVNLNPRGAK